MVESVVRLRVREGTATEWTTANPVLLSSEMGREINTNRIKFGDGVNAWATLPYFGAPIIADGDKGDVVVSGNGSLWTLDITNLTPAP